MEVLRGIAYLVRDRDWGTYNPEIHIFEMEDQRNWTDASYKTCVRPLALPWPYCRRERTNRSGWTVTFIQHGQTACTACGAGMGGMHILRTRQHSRVWLSETPHLFSQLNIAIAESRLTGSSTPKPSTI